MVIWEVYLAQELSFTGLSGRAKDRTVAKRKSRIKVGGRRVYEMEKPAWAKGMKPEPNQTSGETANFEDFRIDEDFGTTIPPVSGRQNLQNGEQIFLEDVASSTSR